MFLDFFIIKKLNNCDCGYHSIFMNEYIELIFKKLLSAVIIINFIKYLSRTKAAMPRNNIVAVS